MSGRFQGMETSAAILTQTEVDGEQLTGKSYLSVTGTRDQLTVESALPRQDERWGKKWVVSTGGRCPQDRTSIPKYPVSLQASPGSSGSKQLWQKYGISLPTQTMGKEYIRFSFKRERNVTFLAPNRLSRVHLSLCLRFLKRRRSHFKGILFHALSKGIVLKPLIHFEK